VHAVLVVPRTVTTTETPTGRAHGVGTSAGPRPAGMSRSAAMGPMPSGSRSSWTGVTRPAARNDDDTPVVTRWTPSGLPQRERSVPSTPIPRRRTTTGSGTRVSDGTSTRKPASASGPAAPGQWLDDFFPNPAADDRNTTDTSLDKGER
jgi:hypothetical protein